MKKLLSLCLALIANAPLQASASGALGEIWAEKTNFISSENAHAYVYSRIIVTGKAPLLGGLLLGRMQANVTTAKPAIAKLCHDVLSRKLWRLYPYVHENFATIADYIRLGKGFFNASSWNAIEEMLRHRLEEFYYLIPQWARDIDQHAEEDEIKFFQRLFIRRVIEWEHEEFYDLLLDEMPHLLSEHDKDVLGYYDSQ